MNTLSNSESGQAPRLHRILQTVALSERDIQERFVRAAGPDGQNPRNEATAVELRLNLAGSAMPLDVKERLIELAGRQVTKKGVLVIVSRVFRLQSENRDAARAHLADLLQLAAAPPRIRKATKSLEGSREQRLVSKHLRGAVKRARLSKTED